MAVENISEFQEEITILNQLLAVQNVIYIFHTPDKVAEFSSAAIKLVPGINFCSFCLLSHSIPYGDSNADTDKFASEISGITNLRHDESLHVPEWQNQVVFHLQSHKYFFGYVFVTVDDKKRFQKYQPAVRNHLNIVAINLENQLQNELLHKNERILEREIKRRTSELRDEMSKHLLSQKALQDSHARYRELSDSIPVGIFECNHEGGITYANKTALGWFGYSEQEMLKGITIYDCLVPEERQKARINVDNILSNWYREGSEYISLRKNGSTFSVIISSFPIYKNGKLLGLRGTISDITSRKTAELALKQKTDDLENLVVISNALISTLEFDDLLKKIVKCVVKLHNIDSGGIYLIKKNELYLHATFPDFPPFLPHKFRFSKIEDHPNIVMALKTGEPVSFIDSSTEKFTKEEQAIIDARHIVSSIFIPIQVQERSIGILRLCTTAKPKVFTSDEIAVYKMLAIQIGLVIENAMFFSEKKKYTDELEKKNQDLQFFGELSFELADLPPTADLSLFLLKKILKYSGASAASSVSYDHNLKRLRLCNVLSEDKALEELLRKSINNYLNDDSNRFSPEWYHAMLSNAASNYQVSDHSSLKRLFHEMPEIRYCSRVSLSASGKLKGAMMFVYESDKALPPVDLLTSIGYIASVKLQRNHSEEELRLSETKLKEIIGNISDVISIIDINWNIIYISQNVETILGFPTRHYIGKREIEFVCPEDIPYMEGILKELLDKPATPVKAEFRKICCNGSYKWVRGSAINLLEEPSIMGILINFEDVDQIKRSEESLIKFRLGIERSPDAFFFTEPDGRISFINPAFTKIYGYSNEDAIGKTPRILKSGIYPDSVYIDFWNTLLSKQIIEGELVNKRKDGKLITIEGSNNPILDQNGKVIGFLSIHRDVTSRKLREEALKLSEERFRIFFMTSPDSTNINRLSDGVYIDVNEGFSMLTGYTREEVIGKSSFEINIWANLEDRETLVSQLSKLGRVQNLEVVFRLKSGTKRICLISSSIIFLNNEPHIISITRDIHEIKQTQEALKESEKRFKQVSENAGEWIWEVDSRGRYTYASAVVEKILGYKADELVGKKYFYDLFIPEQRDNMKKEAFKVFHEKKKFDKFINKNINKTGETVYLETTGAPIFDKDGNLTGYLGADTDVTERLQNEEKLRKLSLAVEQSPASIVITNTKGEIEYVNNRFIELTGYTWDELSGNNPRVLKSGKTRDTDYKKLWESISAGKEWRGEFYNRKKNGEYFWESASISPIFDGNGKITHYLGIKEDITDKKGAAKLMIDKIIETEERERLRYSNELHDGLGPIISTIKLYFQLLNENTDPEQKKLIIEKADNCIDEAIQSLKEISHNLSPNVVNKFGLITGIQSFINRLKETHVFEIDFNSDLTGRLERNVEVTLYRIVTEMINNTYKYANASKVIIDLKYSCEESLVTLQYKDNGKGFNVEKTLYKGRGLGIASIYQRVNAMNGRTILRSENGKGVFLIVELYSLIL